MNEYQMRRLLLSILVSFLVMQISAQELTVKSFVENTKDLSASTNPRNDNNGTPCALVKVRIAAKGVLFEGNVVGNVDYRTSEYWVYMAKGSKRLTLKLEDYLPLDVAFADYAINALESKMTYMLTITKEPMRNVVQIQSEPKPEEHYDDVQPLEFAVSGVTFKMMYVKGGSFTMGASLSDAEARDDESPRHKVTVDDFYLCSHEVTQALWRAVMGSEVSNNGGWQPESGRGNNYPVYKVTWNECMTFINRLNTLLAKQLKGKKFCLPTEAEWEYAARGGQKSKGYKYSGSNNLGSIAWYADNSNKKAHQVGQKAPNELGLYDMLGNVWEWCSDWKGDYSNSLQSNPKGPSSGTERVFRGGSCNYQSRFCRVSRRSGFGPDSIPGFIGLRLALK